MLRALLVCSATVVLWSVGAQAAGADDVEMWPSTGPFYRDTGYYLSPWKILGFWLLFLFWVRTTDWVSQDTQHLKLRWTMWNAIVFFSFFVALLLFFLIPNFWVGLTLLIIAYAAPLGVYINFRNKQVSSTYDKIFTAKHTRRWFAQKMNAIGIKMAGADIDPRDLGPQIKYTPRGAATDRDDNVNLLTARQNPGYMPSRELLDDALVQRATHVMLEYTPEAVGVRYQVDGVWHDRSSLERVEGDPILEVFKGIAGLNIKDRRSRQSGQFGVEAGKSKYDCKIASQGTSTGERVVLHLEPSKVPSFTLDELGMRPKMQERLTELLSQPGLVVFCSMPGGGLTTAIDQVLSNADRFTRAFSEVIDSDKPHRDIENVHPTPFSSAAGQTPATVLPKLVREYPDVIIVRDVADLDTLSILCEQRGEDRLAITSTRAKEAVEALLRLMMLKIPPAEFADAVTGVLNVRLIRKLCEKCREAYPPPAKVLQQLGLPAGRIEALYRPPTEPIDPKHPDVVCDQCNGVGYLGRTGIFELLVVDDLMRKMLVSAPKLDKLRAAARKSKHRSLQDEGVLLVARGVTSLQELLRVLKQ